MDISSKASASFASIMNGGDGGILSGSLTDVVARRPAKAELESVFSPLVEADSQAMFIAPVPSQSSPVHYHRDLQIVHRK